MNDHQASDEVNDLLYHGIGQLDYVGSEYNMATDQPKHTSWLTIDAQYADFHMDVQTTLEYYDATAMQSELVRLVERVITPKVLEFVRAGHIKNLSVRIGPQTFGDVDLNEENEIEARYGKAK